ncbi:MAG: hypothetical protein WCK49_00215 [Myxococcaceae bacterium]
MKKIFYIIQLLLLTVSCSGSIDSENLHPTSKPTKIWLKAESYLTHLSGKTERYKSSLGRQIELGGVDGDNESIPVLETEITQELLPYVDIKGSDWFLRIEQKSYLLADAALRSRMQDKIFINFGAVKGYHPVLDLDKSELQNEPILARLHPNLSAFGPDAPIEQLLSSFGRQWAKKNSEEEGPNCFFSAIASLNEGWNTPRFMSEPELMCHLKRSFIEIDELTQFGDALVLFGEDGTPEHAATYVGQLSTGEKIIFTKNGRRPSFYLFMDLDTITGNEHSYKGSKPKFFRSIKTSLPSDCSN